MTAQIGKSVQEAAQRLRAGEPVAIPTETVYGLAANALDAAACLRVFEAKRRPSFDPLIVHVGSLEMAEHITTEIPNSALELARAFWPGPLTLLLPRASIVPDLVTSGLDTVGVRQPAHPLTQELLDQLDFPLAAPSANPFGAISPTRPEHVVEGLGDAIGYVLDGGVCEIGVESTIVGWQEGAPILHRPGGVPLEAIERLIGPVRRARTVHDEQSPRSAPGTLSSHYAPRTPLELGSLEELIERYRGSRVAVLSFREAHEAHASVALSPSGDLFEAARRLFSAMRTLDASGAERILAELVPEEGLGRAINDRLRRAAAPTASE